MTCMPKIYIGGIGAFAFYGAAMSCFFLPAAGDKYGRYSIYMLTMFLQLPAYVLCNLTTSLSVIYVLCFYLGVALIGRFTMCFVMLTECTPKKYQALIGSCFQIGDCMATLYITFYFRFLSHNMQALIWFGFAMNLVGCVLSLWIVESPAWLVSIGDVEKAKASLAFIAKFNGINDF